MRTTIGIFAALGLLILAGDWAHADSERPWAVGITPSRQEHALKIFERGNGAFAESKYTEALALYREALGVWDHPAIRYNAAVALIQLDQPLLAYENLEAALAYGAGPFDSENYRQALLYQKLLIGQLSELDIVCNEPGALVSLDGEEIFVGPGQARRRLPPGPHQLVAEKKGLMTESRALQLPPGKITHESLALKPLEIRLVRRWEVWKPWAVVGASIVAAAIGTPFTLLARSNRDSFHSNLSLLCPTGCSEKDLPGSVTRSKDSARLQNQVALGFYGLGAATLLGGAAMVFMNQLHPAKETPVRVAPVIHLNSAGLVGTIWF